MTDPDQTENTIVRHTRPFHLKPAALELLRAVILSGLSFLAISVTASVCGANANTRSAIGWTCAAITVLALSLIHTRTYDLQDRPQLILGSALLLLLSSLVAAIRIGVATASLVPLSFGILLPLAHFAAYLSASDENKVFGPEVVHSRGLPADVLGNSRTFSSLVVLLVSGVKRK